MPTEQSMDWVEERPVNSSSVLEAIPSMKLTASVVAAPNHKIYDYIRYRIDESPPCYPSYTNPTVQVTPFAIRSCVVATVTPEHGNEIQAYVSPFYLRPCIYLASFFFPF